VRTARRALSGWPSGHLVERSGFAQSIRRNPPSPADSADSTHLPGAASAATPGRPAHVVPTAPRSGSSPAGASAPGTLRRSQGERRPKASAKGRAQVGPIHGRTAGPLRKADPGSRCRSMLRTPPATAGGHRELRGRFGDLLPMRSLPTNGDSSPGEGGTDRTWVLRLPEMVPRRSGPSRFGDSRPDPSRRSGRTRCTSVQTLTPSPRENR